MIPPCIPDTDILSEYFKGDNVAVTVRTAQYAHEHGAFSFASVSVYEIVYGLEIKGAAGSFWTPMSRQTRKMRVHDKPERRA